MIASATAPAAGIANTGRDYISWSAITTYQQCPLRYYFRYVRGLPEESISASLVFGSAIHRAVELHFQELLVGNEPPCLEALAGEYDRAWQEADQANIRFGKDDDRESLANLARKMLAIFQRSPFAQLTGEILGIEEPLRGDVIPGCPDVLGRIDLLIEEPEALVLTDLKTSRSRWSADQAADSAGQLYLYHELIRPMAPGKQLRLRFAVLTKGKEPSLELHEVAADPRQISRTKRIVERIWRSIQSGHFYPAPSAMNCPGCAFRGPCQAWPN